MNQTRGTIKRAIIMHNMKPNFNVDVGIFTRLISVEDNEVNSGTSPAAFSSVRFRSGTLQVFIKLVTTNKLPVTRKASKP